MSVHSDTEEISAVAARWVVRRNAGLSAPESAELGQWLAADSRHAAAFGHYARAWSAFDGPEREGARDAMIHRIKTRVKHRRLRRVGGAVAAAACAAVALAFVTLGNGRGTSGADGPLTANPPTAGIAVLQPERRVLEDGSTVELRPGAVIDVRYDDTTRRVILEAGEAYFQVAKGQPRPFVVTAGNTVARAVGTQFTVQLNGEHVEVLVTEGHVSVGKTVTKNADAPASGGDAPSMDAPPLAMLGARERIVVKTAPVAPATLAPDVAPKPEVETLTPREINAQMEWRIPVIEFSATPLAEAVAQFNRFPRMPDGSENARLVLAPELSGLASEPVSGLFRADNIEAFVHLLGVNMNIEGERHGDEIILRKAKN